MTPKQREDKIAAVNQAIKEKNPVEAYRHIIPLLKDLGDDNVPPGLQELYGRILELEVQVLTDLKLKLTTDQPHKKTTTKKLVEIAKEKDNTSE